MAWQIELSSSAERDLDSLDLEIGRRVLKFLYERVANLENPRSLGQALTGSDLGSLWRYRVGDYRILCDIQDQRVLILVVEVGHRREVYR
ncbi:MAG TPA: type II toxin-antitoxin system RelE/ParE family toxin [Acidobacteriaceae bacterium]|nr:type II toxin-antitoxin system RelE/ParE family toxin [Acidobacteriaceae bacterium]